MIYSSDFVFLFVREYKKNNKTEVILVNEEQKVFSFLLYSQTQFKLPELNCTDLSPGEMFINADQRWLKWSRAQ